MKIGQDSTAQPDAAVRRPALNGVLETAVYVEDVERSIGFYQSLFGWQVMLSDYRFCAFNVAERQVFLLFRRGATLESMTVPGGVIPPHDGTGQMHTAFAIDVSELVGWEKRLADLRVDVESKVSWPAGGISLYFRDPDGNLLELATPGIWQNY